VKDRSAIAPLPLQAFFQRLPQKIALGNSPKKALENHLETALYRLPRLFAGFRVIPSIQ